jgi:hypothetical protein
MTMKDDYLWDGSGEPDAEIEKLEGLLGRYRSERPAPELPETPVVPFRPRRAAFVPYAAAAAVLLMLSLGVWIALRAGSGQKPEVANGNKPSAPAPPPTNANVNRTPVVPRPPEEVEGPKNAPQIATVSDHDSRPKPRHPKVETTQPAPTPEPETKIRPLVDVATAAHVQQAEILLRSFRNASVDDDDAAAEVAFDSQQSRELLDQNAVLRNAAKVKKNLVASQLLGDIEPYLIDIASLGDKPSRDDVREIQQRLEQREIVNDLSLYSINRPVPGL